MNENFDFLGMLYSANLRNSILATNNFFENLRKNYFTSTKNESSVELILTLRIFNHYQ